ncbi:zinc-dependent peptidase [Flavobacterium sp. RHBU_24]|uniref:zinc-dependent peptidase n=1 Tax=Flavobacterium sp. RHBU_24 TaxID=3391185 RepID=UPI003984E545
MDGIGLAFMVIVCLMFIGLFFYLFFYLALNVLESIWVKLFGVPVYVHFYPVKKEISINAKRVLEEHFGFYNRLSARRQSYFRHRVYHFIKKYEFHGREGMQVTDEMRVKIAATWVMLTFGMRNYLPNVFKYIIISPDVYESVTGNRHKGEFNHPAEAVIFSWRHFEEGMKYGTDNINLGLHEFAHVLHVHATGTDEAGASGVIYATMFDTIIEYINHGENLRVLSQMGYLRDYAFTNRHEFMAVTLECFFETPDEFRQKLPVLYGMAAKMINYRHG